MVKPEGQPSQIPARQKKQKGSHEVSPASKLEASSDTHETNQDTQDGKKRNNIRRKLSQFWVYLSETRGGNYLREMFWHEKSAFWTMVFTGLLFYVTLKLVSVTNKVDETTRATQRAFLSFTGIQNEIKAIDLTQKVSHFQIIESFENSGTTPTKKIIARVNFKVDAQPLPKGFDFPYEPSRGAYPFVIGPKRIAQISPIWISVDTLRDIQLSRVHLYIWGEARYHDIFDGTPEHITQFCVEVANVTANSSDLSDPATIVKSGIQSCAEHNCYDEECKAPKE
jgi:hypothetical protein